MTQEKQQYAVVPAPPASPRKSSTGGYKNGVRVRRLSTARPETLATDKPAPSNRGRSKRESVDKGAKKDVTEEHRVVEIAAPLLAHKTNQRTIAIWRSLASSGNPVFISKEARKRGYVQKNERELALRIIGEHWRNKLAPGVYSFCSQIRVTFEEKGWIGEKEKGSKKGKETLMSMPILVRLVTGTLDSSPAIVAKASIELAHVTNTIKKPGQPNETEKVTVATGILNVAETSAAERIGSFFDFCMNDKWCPEAFQDDRNSKYPKLTISEHLQKYKLEVVRFTQTGTAGEDQVHIIGGNFEGQGWLITPIKYDDARKEPFQADSKYSVRLDSPGRYCVTIAPNSMMKLVVEKDATHTVQVLNGMHHGSGKMQPGRYAVEETLTALTRQESPGEVLKDDEDMKYNAQKQQYWWAQECLVAFNLQGYTTTKTRLPMSLEIGGRAFPCSHDWQSSKEGFQDKKIVFTEPAFANADLVNAAEIAGNVATIFCSSQTPYLEQVERAYLAGAEGVVLINDNLNNPNALFEFPDNSERSTLPLPVMLVSQNVGLGIRSGSTCSCSYAAEGGRCMFAPFTNTVKEDVVRIVTSHLSLRPEQVIAEEPRERVSFPYGVTLGFRLVDITSTKTLAGVHAKLAELQESGQAMEELQRRIEGTVVESELAEAPILDEMITSIKHGYNLTNAKRLTLLQGLEASGKFNANTAADEINNAQDESRNSSHPQGFHGNVIQQYVALEEELQSTLNGNHVIPRNFTVSVQSGPTHRIDIKLPVQQALSEEDVSVACEDGNHLMVIIQNKVVLERKLAMPVKEVRGGERCWDLDPVFNILRIHLDKENVDHWHRLGTKTTFAVMLTQSYRYATETASLPNVGEIVIAKKKPGVVVSMHPDTIYGMLFDIQFDDGDSAERVPAMQVSKGGQRLDDFNIPAEHLRLHIGMHHKHKLEVLAYDDEWGKGVYEAAKNTYDSSEDWERVQATWTMAAGEYNFNESGKWELDLEVQNIAGRHLSLPEIPISSAKTQIAWKGVMCQRQGERVAMPGKDGLVKAGTVVDRQGTIYKLALDRPKPLLAVEKVDETLQRKNSMQNKKKSMERKGSTLSSKKKKKENARDIQELDVMKDIVLPSHRFEYKDGAAKYIHFGHPNKWADSVIESQMAENRNRHYASGNTVCLNEGNHFPSILPAEDLREESMNLLRALQESCKTVTESISLKELSTVEQVMHFKAVDDQPTEPLSDATDVQQMADYVVPSEGDNAFAKAVSEGDIGFAEYLVPYPSFMRARSKYTEQRKPILVTAGAGAGKTWMMNQLLYLMCSKVLRQPSAYCVPFMLSIQQISKAIKRKIKSTHRAAVRWMARTRRQSTSTGADTSSNTFRMTIDWLVEIKSKEFPEEKRDAWVAVIRHAFATRQAVVILDGIDEGGELRRPVVDFITQTLIHGGHRVVATSRPEGIPAHETDAFQNFCHIELAPVSTETQKLVLEQQHAGEAFFENMFAVISRGESEISEDVRSYFTAMIPVAELAESDDAFDTRIEVLRRVVTVPVLMSLLVVACGDGVCLPSSVADLYTHAVENILYSRCSDALPLDQPTGIVALAAAATTEDSTVAFEEKAARAKELLETELSTGWLTIKQVSSYVHFMVRQRLFGTDHVMQALEGEILQMQYWFNHAHISETTDSIPCFKTLDVDSKEAAYQSCHMSLQEFLTASYFYDFLCTKQDQVTLDALSITKPQLGSLHKYEESTMYNIFKWFEDKNIQASALNDKWNENMLAFLKDFKHISKLMFSNKIADFAGSEPSLSLDGLTRLSPFLYGVKHLSLKNSKLDDAKITLLSNLLAQKSTILTLDLSDNQLGVEEAKAVSEFLQTNKVLTQLDLSGNVLMDDAVKSVASGIKTNEALKTLSVAKTEISAEGAYFIAEALLHNKTLQSLDMCGMECGAAHTALADSVLNHAGMEKFCGIPMLQLRQNALTGVDLSGKLIGMHGAVVLASLLAFTNRLQNINVSNNRLEAKGISYIVKGLNADISNVHNGHILDITSNNLCGQSYDTRGGLFDAWGVMALSDALRANQTLRRISFNGDKPDSADVTLDKDTVDMDLSENSLGVAGAIIVAAFLAKCEGLKSLVFCGDYVDSEPVEMWTEMEQIDLRGQLIGMSGAIMLGEMVPLCTNLKAVYLANNGIPGKEKERLEKIIADSQKRNAKQQLAQQRMRHRMKKARKVADVINAFSATK